MEEEEIDSWDAEVELSEDEIGTLNKSIDFLVKNPYSPEGWNVVRQNLLTLVDYLPKLEEPSKEQLENLGKTRQLLLEINKLDLELDTELITESIDRVNEFLKQNDALSLYVEESITEDTNSKYQRAKRDALKEIEDKVEKTEYDNLKKLAKADLVAEVVSGVPCTRDFRSIDEKLMDGAEYTSKKIKEERAYRRQLQGQSGLNPEYLSGYPSKEEQLSLEVKALESEAKRREAVDKILQEFLSQKKREQELFEQYKKRE